MAGQGPMIGSPQDGERSCGLAGTKLQSFPSSDHAVRQGQFRRTSANPRHKWTALSGGHAQKSSKTMPEHTILSPTHHPSSKPSAVFFGHIVAVHVMLFEQLGPLARPSLSGRANDTQPGN